jgi:lysylphosphatidylglycerol synthase-like protein
MPDAFSASMLRRAGHVAIMLAGLTALALVVRHIGPATIGGLIRQIGWSFWLITMLYAAHTALRGVALWQTLPPGAIPLLDVIGIRFGAEGVEMLTLTGPFLAEPAKAWLLHRRGIDTPAAFGAVAAEYLLYNLTAAWLGAGALGILLSRDALLSGLKVPAEGLLVGVAALTVGCAVTAVTGRGLIASSVHAIARRVAPRRADAAVARVGRVEGVLVAVLHDDPRRLAAMLAVELAGHALLALEIFVTLHALGLNAGPRSAFIIEGAVKWIGALFFFVPGQIGVSEGIYAVLLPAVGLPAAAGVTIALVRRARALLIGGLGFLFFVLPARNGPQP